MLHIISPLSWWHSHPHHHWPWITSNAINKTAVAAADLSDISAAFSKLWSASYPPEQLQLDVASTRTQVHPCAASWHSWCSHDHDHHYYHQHHQQYQHIEQLHLNSTSTWTRVHHCVASWQQPAPCSDPLDDYNTTYNQRHGKHLYQLVHYASPHCTALVKLHVRIASWRWNAWKISDVSEHSAGAAMHNTCIYQRIWAHLDTMGRLAIAYQRI